ncbi:MAG: pyridoxamine 5'-phosphate oxidase family protein [Euryarchaeota archaeon]|nr:pyridoxamine 5'-phosphate oxidase family protein [Euryarchaeota archaeon]
MSIIKNATICRIALSVNKMPYIVPMNFGYKDNRLYLHSASEGKKIDIIRENNNICFEMDIKHDLVKSESPCHYGMKYCSVIGFGKAYLVDDLDEKNNCSEHYYGALYACSVL